ncbi:MAG: TetR family transcriptional regulator [Myxococcaceae bacterium]
MKLKGLLVAAVLAFSATALGAGSLDALRTDSRQLREQVATLRAKQLEGRNELSTLSARIQTLKEQSKGKLLPGGELDSALKRSQELSGALSDLSQQLTGRESALETANLSLLDALSLELTRQRAEFDRQPDRGVRRQLIDSMRKLRLERDALRQTLPAAKLPALDTLKASDDPEELLEQADLLRDNEEKLRKELKAVESRIAERREEQELDRRVQRFMGEESMFDDTDRRLRLQRTVSTPTSAPTKNETGVQATNDPKTPVQSGTAFDSTAAGTSGPAPTAPTGGVTLGAFGAAPAADRSNAESGGFGGQTTPGALDSSNIRVTNASDARPQLGGTRPVAGGNDDDLSDLEVERARLQGLAEQLKKKAKELEQRAAQLK